MSTITSNNIFIKILKNILSVSVTIDAINGLLIILFGDGAFSFGTVIRTAAMIIMLIIVFSLKNFETILKLLLAFFVLIFSSVYGVVFYNINLFSNLPQIIKVYFFCCLLITLSLLTRKGLVNRQDIYKIINTNLNCFIFIYLFSYISKIEQASYSSGQGYKAMFNATNSTTAVIIIFFCFLLGKIIEKKATAADYIKMLFIMISLVLIGTKSSIFFSVFTLLMYASFLKPKELLKYVFFLMLFLVPFSLIVYHIFYEQINSIISRQIYFIGFHRGDIISILLSGRNHYLNMGTKLYMANLNPFTLLFGISPYMLYNKAILIEMDLFDILFTFGLSGLLITYGFLIIRLKNLIFIKNKKDYSFEIVILINLLIFSILGGHILVDIMVSTFLALILSISTTPSVTGINCRQLKPYN